MEMRMAWHVREEIQPVSGQKKKRAMQTKKNAGYCATGTGDTRLVVGLFHRLPYVWHVLHFFIVLTTFGL